MKYRFTDFYTSWKRALHSLNTNRIGGKVLQSAMSVRPSVSALSFENRLISDLAFTCVWVMNIGRGGLDIGL